MAKRQTSIAASRAAREHSAAAEQVRTSCDIVESYCAGRETREGVERARARRGRVTQRRHGGTSCYAAIPIMGGDMQSHY